VLTTPLHLVLRLSISGAKLLHPLYDFMEGTGTTLHVSLQSGVKFNVYGSVHPKYIPVYVYIMQQDATSHSSFQLETALHVSGGTSTHHEEHKQLYLQHLVFVTPLLLPTAIVEELELV
jgi:hypothetical protein